MAERARDGAGGQSRGRRPTPPRIRYLNGALLTQQYRMRQPLSDVPKIIGESKSPSLPEHPALLRGDGTTRDLALHTVRASQLMRTAIPRSDPLRRLGAVGTTMTMEEVERKEAAMQSHAVMRNAMRSDSLLVDATLCERVIDAAEHAVNAYPFPAIRAHKPFNRIRGVDRSSTRLGELEGALASSQAAIRELGARSTFRGRPPSSLGDVVYRIRDASRGGREATLLPRGTRQPARTAVDAVCKLVSDANVVVAAQNMYVNSMLKDEFSSFGRFFTRPQTLRQIAERMAPLLDKEKDCFVDFSAGTNEFGQLLGVKNWFGVDIYPPPHLACSDHFRCMNWFDVTTLPPDTIIGLNPPFGIKGELASQFVDHALTFRPRLLALIVPESTATVRSIVRDAIMWKEASGPRMQQLANARGLRNLQHLTEAEAADVERELIQRYPPPPYLPITWDRRITAGGSFYRPGSTRFAAESRESQQQTSAMMASAAAAGGSSSATTGAGVGAADAVAGSTAAGRSISSSGDTSSALGKRRWAPAVPASVVADNARINDTVAPEDAPSFFLLLRSTHLRRIADIVKAPTV